MPAYDRVLGSHLALEGVARPARAEAERRFRELASADDSDMSANDRVESMRALAEIPGVQLALACESEELERYLLIANDGAVRTVMLADSRSPDALDPPTGKVRPKVSVAGDVDTVIERLHAGGARDPIYDHGDGTIELPFEWTSRDELVRALVDVAPRLATPATFLVEIDGRRFELAAGAGRLRCDPLYLVAPDDGPGFGAAFLELARLPSPSAVEHEEIEVQRRPKDATIPAPMRDPGRPYTTGTAAQRRASVDAATAAKTTDFARLIAALQDPANSDGRYDQVRRDIYRYLAPHDTREVAGVFLWALQEESEAVIETVTYLAWRQSALLAALPDLLHAAEVRGDRRTAVRLRAALDEART